MTQRLSSLTHPLVKALVRLRESAAERLTTGSVLIQGSKMIAEIARQTPVKRLLVTEESLIPPHVAAQEWRLVTPEIIQKIAGVVSAEGIVAEVAMPAPSSLQNMRRILALDGIADPGNLGTLLRTALAFGWEGAFLVEPCCDPYNDKALRAAMGATFRLPLRRGTAVELQKLAETKGWQGYVADLTGDPPEGIPSDAPLVLILGSEASGPSPESLEWARPITLPMTGAMESLNVSVAGAILLYLIRRPVSP